MKPEDLVNPQRKSGYDHVQLHVETNRRKRYRGRVRGKDGTNGPWRETPQEAADDYCLLVLGTRYAPPRPSRRLATAAHTTVKTDKQVSDKRAEAYRLLKEASEEESTTLEGYIYCISDGTAMKIGMSVGHPQNRLKSLQTGNPRLLELLAFKQVPDRITAEAELHSKYLATNILGEWFKYDKRILKEFK